MDWSSGVSSPSAHQLRRLLIHDGGFTIHRSTGEAFRHGLAVCGDPCIGIDFPAHKWRDGHVASWLTACRRPLHDSDLHLGGWLDAHDRVWLDAVRVFPSHRRGAAIRHGLALEQHAGFDLTHNELIHLADHRVSATSSTAGL